MKRARLLLVAAGLAGAMAVGGLAFGEATCVTSPAGATMNTCAAGVETSNEPDDRRVFVEVLNTFDSVNDPNSGASSFGFAGAGANYSAMEFEGEELESAGGYGDAFRSIGISRESGDSVVFAYAGVGGIVTHTETPDGEFSSAGAGGSAGLDVQDATARVGGGAGGTRNGGMCTVGAGAMVSVDDEDHPVEQAPSIGC